MIIWTYHLSIHIAILIVITKETRSGTIAPFNESVTVEKGKNVELKWTVSYSNDEEISNAVCGHSKPKYSERTDSLAIGLGGIGIKLTENGTAYGAGRLSVKSDVENKWLSLVISNTEYDDSKDFGCTVLFLNTNAGSFKRVTGRIELDVQGGPEKCGGDNIPSNISAVIGQSLQYEVHICGNPKPEMKASFTNNATITTVVGSPIESSLRKYKYKLKLPEATAARCGGTLSYSAVANQRSEVAMGAVLLNIDFTPEAPVITSAVAKNEPTKQQTCIKEIIWKEPQTGLCMVSYTVQLLNAEKVIQNISKNSITWAEICLSYTETENITHVRIRTIKSNGGQTGAFSSLMPFNFESSPAPTKSTTATTEKQAIVTPKTKTQTGGLTDSQRNGVIGGVIGAVVLIIIIVLLIYCCCYVKRKRKKVFYTEEQTMKPNIIGKRNSAFGIKDDEERNNSITEISVDHTPTEEGNQEEPKSFLTEDENKIVTVEAAAGAVNEEEPIPGPSSPVDDTAGRKSKRKRKSRRDHSEKNKRDNEGKIQESNSERPRRRRHHSKDRTSKRNRSTDTDEENDQPTGAERKAYAAVKKFDRASKIKLDNSSMSSSDNELKPTPEPSLVRVPPVYETVTHKNELVQQKTPSLGYEEIKEMNPGLLYAELGPGGREQTHVPAKKSEYAEVAVGEDGHPQIGDNDEDPPKDTAIVNSGYHTDTSETSGIANSEMEWDEGGGVIV